MVNNCLDESESLRSITPNRKEVAIYGTPHCTNEKINEEIADLRVYRKLLGKVLKNPHPPAARLMLGFHNLVSKAIQNTTWRHRTRVYCWNDYEADLSKIEDTLKVPQNNVSLMEYGSDVAVEAAVLPGLGSGNCKEYRY
jgi:hypothetical protein